MISAALQEKLALGLVALAVAAIAWNMLRGTVAGYLLKKGKVKWAMRLRGRSGSSCGDCKCR